MKILPKLPDLLREIGEILKGKQARRSQGAARAAATHFSANA